MARLINQDGADVTSETLSAMYKAMGKADGYDIRKAATITTSSGLVAYDLEAPAKNLYPVLTPLRNRIPRTTRGAGAGDAAHWKAVTAIAGGGVASMGWVPEGQRAARMTVTTEDKSASYVTLGEEADVTMEAQSAGQGFEDVLASTGMRALQSMMIKEEYAILAGNRSVDLGTPTTPTTDASGTGATLPTLTYSIYVFALTHEGYLAATVAGGIKRSVSITGMDGQTYTLNGGSSKTSAQATQAVTLGQTLYVSTPAIRGAVAYAWFVGAAGAEKLEKITTINSAAFSAALAGTGQAYSAISDGSTDRSKNSSLAYDGLLYSGPMNSSTLAYYKALDTGTPGTGTTLTATGDGSIAEIDAMLQSFWDNYRISPEEIYVSAQELKTITRKVLTGSGTPLVRFASDVSSTDPKVLGGHVVGSYFNPFTVNGGQVIPIRLHPNIAPGTIFAWAENLPAYYESANVPQTAVVQARRDYYQINWTPITRRNETGVYCESVLKVSAAFSLGAIVNVAPSS